MVVIAPLCGCGDRLNHLYHEPNHRAAEQALADFEAFAGESVGLRPTLLTNLSARAALGRRVAATRNDVDDQDRVTALLGKTWTGLRSDTFREFGLSVTPQQVQDQRPSLDPIIAHRLKQLEALAEVLEALGEGQTALIRQANADIKRFSDAAKAPTPVAAGAGAGAQPEAPATDEQLTLQLVNLLVEFRRAVREAGASQREAGEALEEADVVRRNILAAVEESRNPAAGFAVVAMVGSGLRGGVPVGGRTAGPLDRFLDELRGRLERLRIAEVEAAVEQSLAKNSVRDGWGRFLDSAKRARALVDSVSARRHAQGLWRRIDPTVDDELFTALRELQKQFDALAARAKALGLTYAPPTEAEYKALTNNQDTAKLVRRELVEFEKELEARFEGNRLDDVASRLLSLGQRMSREVDRLRTQVEEFPATAAAVEELLSAAAAGKKADRAKLEDAGYEVMRKVLAANPALLRGLQEKLIEDKVVEGGDLEHLGSIVNDLRNQQAAAARRIASLLLELYRTQLALHQENTRHYVTMLSIAREELKRWSFVREINKQMEAAYDVPGAAGARLFLSEAQLTDWNALGPGGAAPGDAAAARLRLHPLITSEETILTSLRSLSVAAQHWQNVPPFNDPVLAPDQRRTKPPETNADLAYDRLRRAVRILHLYTLLTSVNQRLAEDHAVVLRTELDEHDLHLDGVVARAGEASLRYQLQDLLAFHSTGVTETDLQVAIGIVHSALLAWIGSGV